MTRPFCVLLSACVAGLLASALVACSGAEGREPRGDVPDTGDSGPDGALPDAGPPLEAGADARPPFDPADEPVTCAAQPCAVELTAGSAHVCARMSDGTARCWGDATFGALGGGEPDVGDEPGPGPTTVEGLGEITQIGAAGRTTCARVAGGEAYCWGANEEGQLGLAVDPFVADDLPHPTPALVDLPAAATRVDVGPRGGCALLGSGAIWCWGANDRLQLGRTTLEFVAGPGEMPAGGLLAARFGLGRRSSFALTGLGALVGWGTVSGREGSLDPDPVPFALPTLGDVTGLAAGPDHTCAIAGASMYCWGKNRRGALCSGLPDDERLPVRATPASPTSSLAHPQRLAASAQTTCVRMTDGRIQCCGDDAFGQLGTGKVTGASPALTPAKVFEREAVQVVVTDHATCALVRDGTVECWGGNEHGELGQGTKDDAPHLVPVRVAL